MPADGAPNRISATEIAPGALEDVASFSVVASFKLQLCSAFNCAVADGRFPVSPESGFLPIGVYSIELESFLGGNPVVSRCKALFVALFFLAVSPSFALQPTVTHPLDALTPVEYTKIYNILQSAGKLAEKTQFTSVELREPVKSVVMAWTPGAPIERKADVILLTENKTFAAVVDISGDKIESYTEMKKDQAPMTESEIHGFDDLLKKDPRIIEALKKRGITDLRLVTCYVTPAGHVDLPEQTPGRRIGWGGCSYMANAKYGWDREVPGIFFIVDIGREEDHSVHRLWRRPHAADHQHLRCRRRSRTARYQAFCDCAARGPKLHHQGWRSHAGRIGASASALIRASVQS